MRVLAPRPASVPSTFVTWPAGQGAGASPMPAGADSFRSGSWLRELKSLAHPCGWNSSRSLPVHDHKPGWFGSPALRSEVLRRARAFRGDRSRDCRGKEEEPSVRGLDQGADRGALVAGWVVHDDHVAVPEVGHEHLAGIGFEPVAVDWSVEHHRCYHAMHAQVADQHGRLALAARVWSLDTSRPGQPLGGKVEAGVRSSCPSNQASRSLRTSARSCSAASRSYFARDPVPGEEAVRRRDRHRQACRDKRVAQLLQRDVAMLRMRGRSHAPGVP